MKLVLNEMWSSRIAVELRRRGLDVVSATEPGVAARYSGVPDDVVLARAQEDGRAIVVLALRPHFDRSQPGIIGAIIRSLDQFLRPRGDRGTLANQVHYRRRA